MRDESCFAILPDGGGRDLGTRIRAEIELSKGRGGEEEETTLSESEGFIVICNLAFNCECLVINV